MSWSMINLSLQWLIFAKWHQPFCQNRVTLFCCVKDNFNLSFYKIIFYIFLGPKPVGPTSAPSAAPSTRATSTWSLSMNMMKQRSTTARERHGTRRKWPPLAMPSRVIAGNSQLNIECSSFSVSVGSGKKFSCPIHPSIASQPMTALCDLWVYISANHRAAINISTNHISSLSTFNQSQCSYQHINQSHLFFISIQTITVKLSSRFEPITSLLY